MVQFGVQAKQAMNQTELNFLHTNVVHNFLCMRRPMLLLKILFHPHNQVIFESTLDELVQEVRGQQLVDVGTWEIRCEWLMQGR